MADQIQLKDPLSPKYPNAEGSRVPACDNNEYNDLSAMPEISVDTLKDFSYPHFCDGDLFVRYDAGLLDEQLNIPQSAPSQ